MSCAELLLELRNLGARVWLEDDRLRVAAPQGALTNEIRRELKDRRSELLDWLKRQDSARHARPALTAVTRPERLPLSYAQQRLWFLYQMEGAGATYNIPLALRLEGELNSAALERALGDVVEREETLRVWLFRLAEGDGRSHVLLLVLHHIAGDGWSLSPLARDLEEAYRARMQNQTPEWEPL